MIYKKIIWVLRARLFGLFFCEIGRNTYIGKPTYISGLKNICIGNNVRIFPGVRLETYNNGRIIIEDNVAIAQNVHITSSDIDLVIGKGTVIAANSYVTNIDHVYEQVGVPVLEQGFKISKTTIGENCFIGMGVAVNAGTVLESNVIVGANTTLRGVYSKNLVISGNPAKILKYYDKNSNKWAKKNE